MPMSAQENICRLPPFCFASPPGQAGVIGIRAGVMGYYPITTALTAEELNASLVPPPTVQEVAAMVQGSMYGFEVPGAMVEENAEESVARAIAYGGAKPGEA